MPNSITSPNRAPLHIEATVLDNKDLKLSRLSLMKRYQAQYAPSPSMRYCSQSVIANQSASIIKVKGRRSGFKGLNTCGSAYCFHCVSKRARTHQEKVNRLLSGAVTSGYVSNLVTFTLPRHLMSVKMKSDVFSGVMKELFARMRMYCKRRDCELYTVKAIDNTIALDGSWNIHVHSIVITSIKLDNLREWTWKTYERLCRVKFGVQVHRYGYDYKPITDIGGIQQYLVKGLGPRSSKSEGTLGLELASSAKGRQGDNLGFHTWIKKEIEEGTAESPETIKKYKSFLLSIKGKRQIDYSRNIKKLLELEPQEEEEEEEIEYSRKIGVSLFAAAVRMGVDGMMLDCIDRYFDVGDNETDFVMLDELIKSSSDEVVLGEYKVTIHTKSLLDWKYFKAT